MLGSLVNSAGQILLPFMGAVVAWFICATIRKSVEDSKWEELARSTGRGVIYAFWHGRMLYFLYHYRGSKGNILVSRSEDGELIARMMRLFGFKVVRGSKSGGGLRAFHQLSRMLRSGEHVAVTPDGPRGPGFRAHQGVITLAGKTGSPILPMTSSFRRKKAFRSWDGFVLPYPFTRGLVVYGEPIFVPRDAGPQVLEAKRLELENTLNQITARADAAFR